MPLCSSLLYTDVYSDLLLLLKVAVRALDVDFPVNSIDVHPDDLYATYR